MYFHFKGLTLLPYRAITTNYQQLRRKYLMKHSQILMAKQAGVKI